MADRLKVAPTNLVLRAIVNELQHLQSRILLDIDTQEIGIMQSKQLAGD
jgi:hypothetical protein